MAGKRQLQISELIRRNFGLVLQSEGSYVYGVEPFVTVTNVVMSPDLSIAKIYMSVFNVEDKQTVILEMEKEQPRLKAASYSTRNNNTTPKTKSAIPEILRIFMIFSAFKRGFTLLAKCTLTASDKIIIKKILV